LIQEKVMPGDYSRFTFDPSKHYNQVRMQQGRVQLDADWNEQTAITVHARAAALRDLVGPCGVPKGSDAFLVRPLPNAAAASDIGILPGRCYVQGHVAISEAGATAAERVEGQPSELAPASMAPDGARFAVGEWVELSGQDTSVVARITAVDAEAGSLTVDENLSNLPASLGLRRVASYLQQPHDPDPELGNTEGQQLQLNDGRYLVYLDSWDREVTGLDDPRLLESALGGADTTTRLQGVWQVGIVAVADGTDCDDAFPDSVVATPSGRMNARTRPPETQDSVCQLPPTAGYRRLENQLYRVEVQRGGSRAQARFKWSRDNGIVSTRIEVVDGRVLTVADVGRDAILGFAEDQWVEIVSDRSRLLGEPNDLFLIESVDAARREIVLTTSAVSLAGEGNLQLRRWDQGGEDASATGVAMGSGWTLLESGVEVLFSEGSYRAGDHWLIPARTATGEIEWPPYEVPNSDPLPQPPMGIEHRYCRLALLDVTGGAVSVTDCRQEFPPLTDICAEDVCFDNDHCQMPGAETVQDALDALCSRPIGGGPIITGAVVFQIADGDNDELVSRFIDTGLGPGRLQVVVGVEQGRDEPIFIGAVDVFDAFEYPAVFAAAEVRPTDGHLRIGIRIQNRENVGSVVRVRWWATQPAADAGEVVVGNRPTIGPTISPTLIPPTLIPTIGPTISPTLIPPTIGPTVGPTISPTLVPPTLRPTFAPTVRPTFAPVGPLQPIGPGRSVTEVRGVGDVFASRLSASGINDTVALAAADVETVAPILGISEVRTRAIIEDARRLERG
jgi:hypothetical protein